MRVILQPVRSGDALLTMIRLPEHFRLEHLQQEFDFVSDADLDNSKRFKFLQLRSDEDPDFRHKPCPAFDREIPEEIFEVHFITIYFLESFLEN